MRYIAAIDISTFIWSKPDFESNKQQYYNLLSVAPFVYKQIKKQKLSILLKRELCELIMSEFPYNMIREISYEFENLTLNFLTNTNWYTYQVNCENTISSIPVLSKDYFSVEALAEIECQKYHLFYNGNNPKHKFIAYNYFFAQKENLKLFRNAQQPLEIDTLSYNSEKEIQDFFDRNRIKFEHNPKHTNQVRYANGEKISPFTCYHQPNGEAIAQRLLEEAFPFQNEYYHFDVENDVYVKFVLTRDLVYHGFDLSDNNNNVPNEVKKKFYKNGKIF